MIQTNDEQAMMRTLLGIIAKGRCLSPRQATTLQTLQSKQNRQYVVSRNGWFLSMDRTLADSSIGKELVGIKTFYGENVNYPYCEKNMDVLRRNGAKFDFVEGDDACSLPDIDIRCELMPFQKQGISFLESRQGCALIADEMGLGKTVQAIGWLQLHPEIKRILIVCPSSLKWQWKHEFIKFTDRKFLQVIDKGNYVELKAEVVIINYDLLPKKVRNYKTEHGECDWHRYLASWKPEAIIMDECHLLKNMHAQRTLAMHCLAKKVKHRICLSGTPFLNRPSELFSILNLIAPDLFIDYLQYLRRYCGAWRSTRWGEVINGSRWTIGRPTNKAELHDILTSTVMLRRKKADVLTQLPDKSRFFIYVGLSNRAQYDKLAKEHAFSIPNASGTDLIQQKGRQMMALRQLASNGKTEAVLDWISNFLESSDEKLVVFGHYHEMLDAIYDKFRDIAVLVDGRTASEDRQKAQEAFQGNKKIRLFIGGLQSASAGLTLTAASNAAIVELDWRPGTLLQAEDRIHRIGQMAPKVSLWYIIAEDTMEKDVLLTMLNDKAKHAASIIDGCNHNRKLFDNE